MDSEFYKNEPVRNGNKREQKLELLRKAAMDSLFNEVIEEIKEGFRISDKESMVSFQKKIFRNK